MSTTAYRAAMGAFSRAVGEHRHQDALRYLEAAERAADGQMPTWVADARRELEAKLAIGRARPLKFGDVDRVIDAVCACMGVVRSDISGERRQPRCVVARRLVCYILRTHSHLSLHEIRELTGRRSHSAIIDALDAVEAMLANPAATCEVRVGGRPVSTEHPRVALAAVEAELGLRAAG